MNVMKLPNSYYNTMSFFVKVESQGTRLLLRTTEGSSPFTIPQNGWMSPERMKLTGKTIYLQATTDSQTAEITVFTR